MKAIFLDIDGVLNCQDTFITIHKEWKETGIRRAPIDNKMLLNLKEIVDETDSKIILTSTWRNSFDNNLNPKNENATQLTEKFKKQGLYIYDKFKKDIWSIEIEILEYLQNTDVENYVIIDDAKYNIETLPNQVTTNWNGDGLNSDLKNIAIKILKKSN